MSIFRKTLTIDEINQFIQEDKLKYLFVEATNGCSYRFNLSNDVEKSAAIQVVTDKNNFTVVGWNIGKIIPNWVKSFEDWNIYISVFNQVNNAGAKSFVDDDIFGSDSNSKANNYIEGFQEDVEAGEKETEENKNNSGMVLHNPYFKVQPEHISSNIKTKFDDNAEVFDVCDNELKKEIATNISKANKSNSIETHACGPFMNSKTG